MIFWLEVGPVLILKIIVPAISKNLNTIPTSLIIILRIQLGQIYVKHIINIIFKLFLLSSEPLVQVFFNQTYPNGSNINFISNKAGDSKVIKGNLSTLDNVKQLFHIKQF